MCLCFFGNIRNLQQTSSDLKIFEKLIRSKEKIAYFPTVKLR